MRITDSVAVVLSTHTNTNEFLQQAALIYLNKKGGVQVPAMTREYSFNTRSAICALRKTVARSRSQNNCMQWKSNTMYLARFSEKFY